MKTPTITEEKTAVESRLAEIENEMSTAHRDHAFDYFCNLQNISSPSTFAKKAWDYCHSIYCRNPRIIIERPAVCGWYIMFAIGVVCGLAISLLTFFISIN